MELIDKNALLSKLNDPKGLILLDWRAALVSNECGCLMRYGDVVTAVESAPSIDAVPVRHGRWVERKTHFAQGGVSAKCTVCKKEVQYLGNPLNYCPSCGAKMDAKDG